MADEAKNTRTKRAAPGPRPGYLILRGANAKAFADEIASGELSIESTSRKADEVLEAIASGEADAYVRFTIK